MKTITSFLLALFIYCGSAAIAGQPTNTSSVRLVFTASITVNNHLTCYHSCDGSASVSVSGGTGPYTYNWAPTGDVNPTVTNLCAGTYSCMVTDASGSTATATVSIREPDSLVAVTTILSQAGCAGSNSGAIQASGTGGTTPYSYYWSSGETNSISSGLSAGSYTCTITDALNCTASVVTSISANPSTDLYGGIILPDGVLSSGYAFAFKRQNSLNGIDTVQRVVISGGANGSYIFPALPAGDYLIKIMLDTIEHPDAVPTYYGEGFQWDSSLVFTHGCATTDTANIQVRELSTSFEATGTITGTIMQGPGYGVLFTNNPLQPYMNCSPGTPISKTDIKLVKSDGGVLACTVTNANGTYSFNGVPDGDYFIYVDIPNMPMDSIRSVSINAGTVSGSSGNDYYVDSTHIYTNESITGLRNQMSAGSFDIYPNPAGQVLNLRFSLAEEQVMSVQICNVNGESVHNISSRLCKKGDNLLSLPVREMNLNAGVYFVSMISKSGKYTQRVVVLD